VRIRSESLRKDFRGIPLNRGSGIDKGQRTISLSFGVAVFPDGKDRVVVAESGPSASPDTTQLPFDRERRQAFNLPQADADAKETATPAVAIGCCPRSNWLF